jgi:tetratricopeptide (TPR) repeat protein
MGNIYYLKGLAYFEIGDYKNLLDVAKKARFIYEKIGDLKMQSESDVLIALAYSNQNDNSMALEILEKTLQTTEKLNYTQSTAHVCWQMGSILLNLGLPDRGLKMLEKAQALYGNEGYEIEKAHIFADKGSCYFFSGEYSQALEQYEKALVLFEKIKIIEEKVMSITKWRIFLCREEILSAP